MFLSWSESTCESLTICRCSNKCSTLISLTAAYKSFSLTTIPLRKSVTLYMWYQDASMHLLTLDRLNLVPVLVRIPQLQVLQVLKKRQANKQHLFNIFTKDKGIMKRNGSKKYVSFLPHQK